MANSFQYAEYFSRMFGGIADEVSRVSLRSQILLRSSGITFDPEIKTVKVKTLDTSGNFDYDRANGYGHGDVHQGWNQYDVNFERGVRLGVDILDDFQTMRTNIADISENYLKHKDIPETDAVVFSRLAEQAGTVVDTDITATTDVVDLIEDAVLQQSEDEVSADEQKVLFVSSRISSMYSRQKLGSLSVSNTDTGLDLRVNNHNGIPFIVVPPARFADTVTLLNTGEGGYQIPSGAKQLNFILMSLNSGFVFSGYKNVRFTGMEVNTQTDESFMLSRHFYDAFVLENQAKGVYVSRAATAKA